MSGCAFYGGDLEGFVFGELPPSRAAALRVHLSACEACAEEVKTLRREVALFRDRAVAEAVATPSFAGVMERMAKQPATQRLSGLERGLIGASLAAAAAFALFFAGAFDHRPGEAASSVVAEEAMSGVCAEGVQEESCTPAVHTVAKSEDECGASSALACTAETPAFAFASELTCCEEQATCGGR